MGKDSWKENLCSLWMRVGDRDSYHSFGQDFDALALALKEAVLDGEFLDEEPFSMYRCGTGISIPELGFDYYNYISLYWGDGEGDSVRVLTDEELALVAGRAGFVFHLEREGEIAR